MLETLLASWQNWSARATLTRALHRVNDAAAREALRAGIERHPDVSALDALRDSTELISLLAGWRWQAVHAARRDGATWEQIALAAAVTIEQAREDYAAAVQRQERHGADDVASYKRVL